MVSIWWILVAFVLGGYAGAVLIGLLAVSGAHDRPLHGRTARNSRIEIARRRRHPGLEPQPAHPSYR